jgi:hypothetical protein
VKLFRQLSTRRLLLLIGVVVAVAVGASVLAMSAIGSSAQTPPAEPLDQAIHDALQAPTPSGITARVRFTNNLFPSGALEGVPGTAGSALMSGATGRLWWSPGVGGRIELQSDAGDAQILWDQQQLTVWDSSSNTVYKVSLPSHSSTDSSSKPDQAPTLADIDNFLKDISDQANVGDAVPSDVAGQPAYRVTVSPAHSAGLIGSLQLAWDATHGVPLDIGLYAAGGTSPVLGLTVTDISYGPVSSSDLAISPPADAKVTDLGGAHDQTGGQPDQPGTPEQKTTGLPAVQAAVPFTVVAPDTLVGLPRRSVQLIGGKDKGALILYGHGLGGIVLVERASDGQNQRGSQLPSVSLGSVTGHELSTQLGTVVLFQQGGVDYVLAGSMPSSGAETAARGLVQ